MFERGTRGPCLAILRERRAVWLRPGTRDDPLNFFCGLWCPAVVGNMVVRRDTGHITNTYAAWLAPMLTPIFKDVSK